MVGAGLRPPAAEVEEKAAREKEQGVYFVLENANLEAGKVGKSYQLLNSDDHNTFLRKNKQDPALFRPDICHQALLAILDSPLAKAGRLKGLYVVTAKNVVIRVSPQVRLPRTFKRFSGLVVQLLQKLSIRATNGPDKLLKVVKGPVSQYLPPGAPRVGFSRAAPNLVRLKDFVATLEEDKAVVFVVGAYASGQFQASYVDRWLAISEYPLSAACVLNRIAGAVENQWEIF